MKKNDLKFLDSAENSFTNWYACYKTRLSTNNDPKFNDLKTFIKSEGFKFLEATEKQFQCASACRPGLFYMTQDLSLGPPQKDCLNEMLISIPKTLTTPAIISIVTGLIFILVFAFSFPLCTGFSDQNKV